MTQHEADLIERLDGGERTPELMGALTDAYLAHFDPPPSFVNVSPGDKMRRMAAALRSGEPIAPPPPGREY